MSREMKQFLRLAKGIYADRINDPVVEFAASELAGYLFKTYSINLNILTSKPQSEYFDLNVTSNYSDTDCYEWNIDTDKNIIRIVSSNSRSLLYAIYAWLEQYGGWKFFQMGHDLRQAQRNGTGPIRKFKTMAAISARGLYSENVNNIDKITAIVNWMPKNGMNSLFLSFQDWNMAGEKLYAEIRKRGLQITVGGHSYLNFLPPEKYFNSNPEYYAIHEGTRIRDGQLCFTNRDALMQLFTNISNYLKQYRGMIDCLSIWPSDNKFYCECDECKKKSFNDHYLSMISNLNRHFNKRNIATRAEHLAYNASLCFEMLKVPAGCERYLNSDTLVAYWGRDYLRPLPHSRQIGSKAVWDEIMQWLNTGHKTGNRVSILEYYLDFWMLTMLYAPLTRVIAADAKIYQDAGVDGVTVLIVPGTYGDNKKKNYPWFDNMQLNAFFTARTLWNPNLSVNKLRANYCQSVFGPDAKLLGDCLLKIERLLPKIYAFNIPLFRLRFPDIWQNDDTPANGGIFFKMRPWTPEDGVSAIKRKRYRLVKKMAAEMDEFDSHAGFASRLEKSRSHKNPAVEVMRYFVYLKDRLHSIEKQLSAQMAIRERQWAMAVCLLREAVKLERKHFNEDTAQCLHWLDKIKDLK